MIFSERLKLKDDVVPIILDPMSHHTSVSQPFHTERENQLEDAFESKK